MIGLNAVHLITFLLVALLSAGNAGAAYAIAQHGEPKYREGFTRFGYVSPDAAKGGTIVLANVEPSVTSFDKLNPFSLRGTVAPLLLPLVFETLAIASSDERNVSYGLLAKDIDVADDRRSVVFTLHQDARFSNGDAVTAADVKYSFDTLKSEAASPLYRGYFSEIQSADVIDRLSIRFRFARAGAELPHTIGTLPVFSRKWGVQPDGTTKPFDRIVFEKPIASGPYAVAAVDKGRGITFVRNKDYWARDLPVRRGTYNFDKVVVRLYGDYISQLEAIKSGEIDAFMEMRARSWGRMYFGKRIDSGELRKGEFEHQNPTGVSAYAFNLRKPRFQDRRVRYALELAYDFEWINRMAFFSQYERLQGYFSRSKWSAYGAGSPSAAELALLSPWRDRLPAEVFRPLPDPAEPQDIRERLKLARQLLSEAGWNYRDGALRNKDGAPFEIEFFLGDKLPIPFVEAYIKSLRRLGIVIKRRPMEGITQQQRRQNFDFDVLSLSLAGTHIPGGELLSRYGSKAADVGGSQNIAGIQSPVVDDLIQHVLKSRTAEDTQAATRALDRVMHAERYNMLQYSGSKHRIAYRNNLHQPAQLPLYYSAYDWLLHTWWQSPGDVR